MTPICVSENGNAFPINRLRHSEGAKIGAHCFEESPFRGEWSQIQEVLWTSRLSVVLTSPFLIAQILTNGLDDLRLKRHWVSK